MSYYPIYEYPPPGQQPGPCYQPNPFYQPAPVHQPPPGSYPPQHNAQIEMPPVPRITRQIVPINSHLVHVTETLTIPGELLPRTKPTSHKQREASAAYDHQSSQSKPKGQSRTNDQHSARLEQPLPPKKAIGYQAQLQIKEPAWDSDDDDARTIVPGPESSRDNVDENGKDKKKPKSSQRVPTEGEPEEQKKPTSSQRVRTKGEPKKQTRIRKWVRSLPEGLDEEAKESSEDSAGTERKHKTKEPGSPQRAHTKGGPSNPSDHGHTQKLIDSQPYVADTQAKGSFVDSAGDERKHTTKNSTGVPHPETNSKRRPEKPAEQAKERGSTKTTDAGRAHTAAHSSSNRPLRCEEAGTSIPAKKSTGHQSKEKATGSSRASQSKKITKEEVQTVSLGDGRMRVTAAYSLPKG